MLNEADTGIASEEAEALRVLEEYHALKSEPGRQVRLDSIQKIGANLDELNDLKKRLTEELSTHTSDLLYFRERLEDELWRELVASGQMAIEDEFPEVESNPPGATTEDGYTSLDGYQEAKTDRSDTSAKTGTAVGWESDSANDKTREAMSLLGAAKQDLHAATQNFRHLDRLCETQRREFDAGVLPKWHDMSRTEFDLEQLAQKVQVSRELIMAERAYSEAGRYAVEVGFIRDDADQSCHFLDAPEDGACSVDRYVTSMEDKDMDFIEAWREKIATPCSKSSTDGDGDVLEVDSVYFGEGCSTHADEWDKIRIDRWESMRAMERVKMHTVGNAASPDDMACQHSPVLEPQDVPPAAPVSAQQFEGPSVPRVRLMKPSVAIMRELLISGQVAVAKFSAAWSSRRQPDHVV